MVDKIVLKKRDYTIKYFRNEWITLIVEILEKNYIQIEVLERFFDPLHLQIYIYQLVNQIEI